MIKREDVAGQLMGTAEVAAYLGWSSQWVAGYLAKQKAGIPAPAVRLKCGPIWLREDIERWARERGYVGGETIDDGADHPVR